ncbi:hypothetical protein GCM10010833_19100 [Blastomonas aquatica]|uniref:Uncharacterized protein n=1 Tax=Blastomonas aquatica TaxID=1510276 RepID=A0ABQ1JAS2_9SPHN|nr:hypothetical protein GCM10010833_19100 [Blastomonas aquatica]
MASSLLRCARTIWDAASETTSASNSHATHSRSPIAALARFGRKAGMNMGRGESCGGDQRVPGDAWPLAQFRFQICGHFALSRDGTRHLTGINIPEMPVKQGERCKGQ